MVAVGVIQARTRSTRLPGKVLAAVSGRPLLACMVERLRSARSLEAIAIATSDHPADEPVRRLAADLGIPCVAGSEHDVLARYCQAAEELGADPVVRLTGDCPLIDPGLVDSVVMAYLQAVPPVDHASLARGFPDGLDAEVVARAALERAAREARLPSEREHVTPYIWKRPQQFRLLGLELRPDLSHLRWTVDEPADLELVRRIYERLDRPGGVFGWREVVALMEREPELAALNAAIERNAGYRRSLAAEAGEGSGEGGGSRRACG